MSPVVEVALIRHGLPNRIEGVTKPDPGLTDDGIEQARAVAEALVLLPVRMIASSRLQRARQTAAPTAEKVGCAIEIHDDLAEFDKPYYGSITRIAIDADGEWKLRTYNEIHHIERLAAYREERNEFSR